MGTRLAKYIIFIGSKSPFTIAAQLNHRENGLVSIEAIEVVGEPCKIECTKYSEIQERLAVCINSHSRSISCVTLLQHQPDSKNLGNGNSDKEYTSRK